MENLEGLKPHLDSYSIRYFKWPDHGFADDDRSTCWFMFGV